MPAAKKKASSRPTVASLAKQVEQLKSQVDGLQAEVEGLKSAVPAEEPVADLSESPVVLVLIDRNTVEVAHSNVPGLKVVVHDADVIRNPSVVEERDRNKTGVVEVEAKSFSGVDEALRAKVRDLGKIELPKA